MGEFCEGKGELIWDNGIKSIGDFKNNKMEGKGKMIWKNEDEYEGDFINGKFECF